MNIIETIEFDACKIRRLKQALQVTLTKLQVTRSKLRPVSNVEFCMHRIQFTLDSTAIVKFDVCFKRRQKTHDF